MSSKFLYIFLICFSLFLSQNYIIFFGIFNDNCIHLLKTIEGDKDGLYDPEILAKYKNISNEESIFLKDFYATTYFKNLNTNFGYNEKGTCGYVATGMLLSFWDTYWDDNVIEDRYDINGELESDSFDYTIDSPGIEMEPKEIYDVSDEEYRSNIFKYSDKYFQFLLISMGDNLYGTSSHKYSMNYLKYEKLFNYYIYDYRGYTDKEVEIIKTNENVRERTIELIKQGIPVKLSVGGHAVIAYDYDEKTDKIYCHFGWGTNSTHVTIESLGYSEYLNLFAFNFKTQHTHSFNFNYDSDKHLCICSTVIPSEIKVSNYYLDTNPTFLWVSLIKERRYKDIELYNELSILDSNKKVVFTINNIYDNEYTLSTEKFKQILNLSSTYYYVYLRLSSENSDYWDDYYCEVSFNKPNKYLNKSSFLPSERGFNGRYYFANELESNYLENEPERKTTTVTSNGLTIITNRLRCGYIENLYVVLSPRREDAGYSYFEMNFSKGVYSFMYRACLWSNKENIDGVGKIYKKDIVGNWSVLKDISLSDLESKSSGLTQFVEDTPWGIYGLRFELTSTAIGSRNKGRFCIDDIVFNTSSGSTNYNYINCDYSTKV